MADKYWVGSIDQCDVCDEPLGRTMYDANIIVDGGRAWANVCQACFDERGLGIGTGLGQKYTRQADGRWLKTGG